MDKREILERLMEQMRTELEATRRASEDAAAYATDEESKAREKWDTQGLEASYLAAGQAGHAKALAADLQRLKSDFDTLASPNKIVEIGAVLGCELGGETDWYFIAPVGGGEELAFADRTLTVMTPRSPLFVTLRGKTRGETAHLANGATLRITALE